MKHASGLMEIFLQAGAYGNYKSMTPTANKISTPDKFEFPKCPHPCWGYKFIHIMYVPQLGFGIVISFDGMFVGINFGPLVILISFLR